MNTKTFFFALTLFLCSLNLGEATCMWSWVGAKLATVGSYELSERDGGKDPSKVKYISAPAPGSAAGVVSFDTSVDGMAFFAGHVGNSMTFRCGAVVVSTPSIGSINYLYSFGVPHPRWAPIWHYDNDGNRHYAGSEWKGWVWPGNAAINGSGGTGYSWVLGKNAKRLIVWRVNPFGAGKYGFNGGQGARWATDDVRYIDYIAPEKVILPRLASYMVTGGFTGIYGGPDNPHKYFGQESYNHVSMTSIRSWGGLFDPLLFPIGEIHLTHGSSPRIDWDASLKQKHFIDNPRVDPMHSWYNVAQDDNFGRRPPAQPPMFTSSSSYTAIQEPLPDAPQEVFDEYNRKLLDFGFELKPRTDVWIKPDGVPYGPGPGAVDPSINPIITE